MQGTATQFQTPNVNAPAKGVVPFRQATVERCDMLPSESLTMTASSQRIDREIQGAGYIFAVTLEVIGTTAANAATVAYAEDGPWSTLDSVVFKDVNGELVNLTGFQLYVANLVNCNYKNRYMDQSALFSATTGAGGTGGSFSFMVDVPVGTNRRDLLGIVGNQDRAQRYSLRSDLAASGSVYSTPPTTLPAVVINKYYENYSVPLGVGPAGQHQQMFPDSFGTLHFTTATTSDAVPAGGSTINHYLRRIGNTIRWIAIILRSNGSRLTAQTNAPTNIRFKLGEDTVFNETYNARRAKMFARFGFDLPNGVLVYDAIHDLLPYAGGELGDDYYSTQALVNGQFLITYPSGFGSTNNSLQFVTDDLIYSTPAVAVPGV